MTSATNTTLERKPEKVLHFLTQIINAWNIGIVGKNECKRGFALIQTECKRTVSITLDSKVILAMHCTKEFEKVTILSLNELKSE